MNGNCIYVRTYQYFGFNVDNTSSSLQFDNVEARSGLMNLLAPTMRHGMVIEQTH